MTISQPRIQGQVTNARTGSPMGGVTVTTSPQVFTDQAQTNATSTLTTDGLGRFSAWAPPAVYTFTTTEPQAAPIDSVTILASDESTPITYQPVRGDPGPAGGVASVNGATGVVVIDKTTVGLPNVDNTSDAAKPVSTAQAAADTTVANNAQTALNTAIGGVLQSPTGSPAVGQVPTVTGTSPFAMDWETPPGGAATVTSVAGKTGAVTLVEGDITSLTTDLAAKVPTTRQVIAGQGLTGGGALSADQTLAVGYGTTAGTAAQGNDSRIVNALSGTRQVLAGPGLAGGGTLTADVTVSRASPAGYLAANYDPTLITNTNTGLTSQTLYVLNIPAPAALSVTNIILYLVSSGSGLTAGQSFAGVYDSSGSLLASSADLTTVFGSSGVKTIPLAGGAVSVARGTCYVGVFSHGTSPPGLGRGQGQTNAALVNGNATGGSLRFATGGTGFTTALPATITLASLTAFGTTYWAGLQ